MGVVCRQGLRGAEYGGYDIRGDEYQQRSPLSGRTPSVGVLVNPSQTSRRKSTLELLRLYSIPAQRQPESITSEISHKLSSVPGGQALKAKT